MQSLATTSAVVRKDLADFLKNRALLLSVLAPVVLSCLFVRAAENADHRVRLALVSASPTALTERLQDLSVFDLRPLSSEFEARRQVEAGLVDLAVVLAKDFDRQLQAGNRPDVTVVTREDRAPVVVAGLSALVESLRAEAGQDPPVSVNLQTAGVAEAVARRARLLSAWILFALLIGFTVVASSLVEERERGTWQAIRVTRAGAGEVLVGKALAGALLAVLPAVAILAVNGAWQSMGGAPLILILGGAAFVVAMGLCLGVLFPNMAAANAGLSVTFLILFVPVFLQDPRAGGAGVWVRILPSYTFMDGLQRALEGKAGLASVSAAALLLVGWAVGCLLVARWLVRRA